MRGLLLEDADELGADRLALGLGLAHALELLQEAPLGVDGDERDLEGVAERADDLLALVLAHQAVVDEHAGELVADGAVHEQRGDGGVHAAGEPADDAPVTDLAADARDLVLDDRRRRPRRLAAADLGQEARQDLLAVGRVHDLGVELDAVDAALHVLDGGDGRGARGGQRGEARRRLEDGVAVGHPAGLLAREVREQTTGLFHDQVGASEFADLGLLDAPAELAHEQLHSVADAEHWDTQLQQPALQPRRVRRVYRRGPPREDDAARLARRDPLQRDVVRDELREDSALAHAARDQLRVLATVVQHDDLVGADRREPLAARLVCESRRRRSREVSH